MVTLPTLSTSALSIPSWSIPTWSKSNFVSVDVGGREIGNWEWTKWYSPSGRLSNACLWLVSCPNVQKNLVTMEPFVLSRSYLG